ncbi:MAG: hypothetical protein KDA28_00600, partial [Phycisphaerales bacterium]|nr:hypothetical protein [Phycisphaerales bacterium]
FDFEERAIHELPMPQHWVRVIQDGFPTWNALDYDVLDYSVASSGEGSARLVTRGGSSRIRLEPGTIPILPSADYLVECRIRTEGLRDAAASLNARFLDGHAQPIPGTERRTRHVREGGWHTVRIPMQGENVDAAFLQIDLDLLQDEQIAPRRGAHDVQMQDVEGRAWFDDLRVLQMPRIDLRTASPGNVVMRPERPQLELQVRDLAGETLETSIVVYDIDGHEVDRWSRSIGAGRTITSFEPEIDTLGWYRAILQVDVGDETIGRRALDFVVVPAESELVRGDGGQSARTRGGSIDRVRFGLRSTQSDDVVLEALPDLARRLATGCVTLPVWRDDLTPETIDDQLQAYRPTIASLVDDWQQIDFALTDAPQALATLTRADPSRIFDVLSRDPAMWRPWLDPYLDLFGQTVRHWHLGHPGNLDTIQHAKAALAIEQGAGAIATLVPGPNVSIPWSIDLQAPGTTRDLVVRVPSFLSEDALEIYATSYANQRSSIVMVPERVDEVTYGHRARAASLVRQAVEAWRHFPGVRFVLEDPWDVLMGRDPQVMPRPELAVLRTLVDALAERDVVSAVSLPSGIEVRVLAPRAGVPLTRGGAIILWKAPGRPPETYRANLGPDRVRVVDPFGNVTLVEATSDDEGRMLHEIVMGDMPVIVEHIDVPLVQFLASVRMDDPLLRADGERLDRMIVFENPWPQTLSGRFSIVKPGGIQEDGTRDRSWRIVPRRMDFTVRPGETFAAPVSIAFGAAEFSGPVPFVLDFSFNADREYDLVRTDVYAEIGLPEMDLEIVWHPTPSGDLVVEAHVT